MEYNKRHLKLEELSLLKYLLNKSSFIISYDLMSDLLVANMNDGEMGSLLLYPKSVCENDREYGGQIAECIFKDSDDVEVIATLNVDGNNELFELDIWKTDFSSLNRIPDKFESIEGDS